MTPGRFARIVVAAGGGAAVVVAAVWIPFALEPGLNDDWPLHVGWWVVGGALLSGALAAGGMVYVDASPEAVGRAPWIVFRLSAVAAILALAYAFLRAAADLG